MAAETFQLRIACIIPQTYDTVVGGANNNRRLAWGIKSPCEFFGAVDRQMELLGQKWEEWSNSRITIAWKAWWHREVVRDMRRHGGRHKIYDPSFKSLRRWCTSEGAMYQFIWIVFPPSIAKDVPDQGSYKHRVARLPCLEAELIKSSRSDSLRSGVADEFRHCLNNALRTNGVHAAQALKAQGDNAKFAADVRNLLTAGAIQRLARNSLEGHVRIWPKNFYPPITRNLI